MVRFRHERVTGSGTPSPVVGEPARLKVGTRRAGQATERVRRRPLRGPSFRRGSRKGHPGSLQLLLQIMDDGPDHRWPGADGRTFTHAVVIRTRTSAADRIQQTRGTRSRRRAACGGLLEILQREVTAGVHQQHQTRSFVFHALTAEAARRFSGITGLMLDRGRAAGCMQQSTSSSPPRGGASRDEGIRSEFGARSTSGGDSRDS